MGTVGRYLGLVHTGIFTVDGPAVELAQRVPVCVGGIFEDLAAEGVETGDGRVRLE
jgi:hypothetical protein